MSEYIDNDQIEIDENKLKKLERAIIKHENELLKQNTPEDTVSWIKKKIEEVVACNS